jgi:hypothetical protein
MGLGMERVGVLTTIQELYPGKEVYKVYVQDAGNNLGIKVYDGQTAEIFLYFDEANHLISVVRMLEQGVPAETTLEYKSLSQKLGQPRNTSGGRGWFFGGANNRKYTATIGVNPVTNSEQIGFALVKHLVQSRVTTVTGSPCKTGANVDYELDFASTSQAQRIVSDIQNGSGQGRILRATVRNLCEDPKDIFARRNGNRFRMEIFACRLLSSNGDQNLGIVPANNALRQKLLNLHGKQICVQGRVFSTDPKGAIVIEDATEAE